MLDSRFPSAPDEGAIRRSDVASHDRSDVRGFNLVPFAIMAGGWLGPLLMFWLYVWGPLRPFDYPAGALFPHPAVFALLFLACVALQWMPRAWFRLRGFERDGRIYEILGVRLFRLFVPDGDLANRLRRRRNPKYRLVGGRLAASAFVRRTEQSERGHLAFLAMGVLSVAFAWQIGWRGWAVYLGVGNVVVNLYPILLQRYTRTRLARIIRRVEGC